MQSEEPTADVGFGSNCFIHFKQERAKWDSETAGLFLKTCLFPQQWNEKA
jgi:hypothetical protein